MGLANYNALTEKTPTPIIYDDKVILKTYNAINATKHGKCYTPTSARINNYGWSFERAIQ